MVNCRVTNCGPKVRPGLVGQAKAGLVDRVEADLEKVGHLAVPVAVVLEVRAKVDRENPVAVAAEGTAGDKVGAPDGCPPARAASRRLTVHQRQKMTPRRISWLY